MNRRRRTLPPVPPKAPSELRPLIAAMTEILETGEGVRGDPLDRKVTLRDLLDSGIGRLKPGMRPGQDGNLDSGALPPAPDLSIPPAPANFDAQGGFYGMINLSWTIPGQQYRNHAYTNIFRSEEDNFANAEVIGREAGGFYTDYVRDDAVDPDDPTKLKGYYYWITFTSVADIEGPPNSPNGTYAAPLADVGYVLELLTGEIDAGVLAQALREEIEKIPALETNIERLDPIETAIERIPAIESELRGPESLDGSVANRLADEREARLAGLDNERTERIDGLLAEAQARHQAIQLEVGNRETAISQAVEQLELEDSLLALQQNVIAAAYDANAASIYSMAQVRINDSEVFAAQIDQLFGSVSDNEALILQQRQIQIDQYSSLATQVGILSARLDTRPSLNSGFEPGADFDAWNATSGSAITPATGDVYSGLQSALVTSTSNSANPNIGGVRRVISPETAVEFAGHEIRVAVYAKQPASNAASEFALAYQVAGQSTQWHRFTPTDQWAFYDVVVDVPEGSGGVEHAVAIWGSTSGGGNGVDVDRLLVTFAETDIPEVTAAIEQIQQALVDQQQAVAQELTGFESQLASNSAAIEGEITARSTQYDALASDLQTLTAQTQDNAADIAAERTAWTTAVDAVAEDVVDLWASVGDNEARVTEESRVRATEDDLLAAVQRVISASRGTAAATFYSLDEVRVSDSKATALRIDGVEVRLEDAMAVVEQEQNLLASQNQALASRVDTISAALNGDFSTVRQTLTTEVTRLDGRVDAQAQLLTAVQSDINGQLATVQQNFNTEVSRIDDDLNANAQAITDVQSATDDALAGVQQDFNSEIDRVDGRINTTAQAVTEVRSELKGDVAGVQQNLNTQVSRLDGRINSTAQSLNTVQSQLSGNISTVQQNLTTSVSRIDDELDANARAITDVQAAADDALAGVQQDFNSEISRVDGRINANANAITEARTDLGSDIAGVQQSLTTNVSRINGELQNNAQAITTVQSQLGGQISTVQQNLSSEIRRVDGEIEATAQLVQSVQTDLGSGLNAVEIKAVTNAGGILSNGQFGTGDLAGWGNTWVGVSVIEANPDGGSSAVRGAPTKHIARWADSSWGSDQYMRGERFAATAGETYTFQFAFASGGGVRDIALDLRVGWVAADGSVSYRTVHAQRVTSTGWSKTPLLSAVAPSETVEAWVYFRRSAGGVGTLYLADVQARRTDMVAGALYTAQVQSGGLIGGFGVYNDGTVVEAGFDVDRFWLGRTNSNKRKPFVMDGDVVYMNNAMIRNGSIQEGQLGPITIGKFFLNDGTPVTTAGGLIRADAIDVDNLSVAEAARFYADVQSGNYIPGQSGWRIRQNGSVEFNQGQFNGTVNVGSVSGLGSLATQNSLSYSSLTGSKPPTNADKTADNTAADTSSVAGTSASTVRDRANAGNDANNRVNNWTRPSSTLIDGNKIFTGDAYVDTLVIKGNAVTIPESVAAGSAIRMDGREILSCDIAAYGANVMVMASFSVLGTNDSISTVQILRNGDVVLQRSVQGRFFSIAGHVGATSGGVDTFSMRAWGTGDAAGRSLGLLATRR
ncbi:hypothetical protein [Halomonas sp. DWK9]|uniref:phage tail tip fiber protein n=1 Tax=Halomonas sp. DWK9 TaxID=3060155 RepID=UPI00287F4BA6|nr:hypothetical protein [Halomonas sp. DWK9]